LRILDLTRVVAGPFATALLADLGADVIKVERPRTGDDYRYGPAPEGETSLSFQNTNRGKRSITLDVGHPEGRDLFLRLVDRAGGALADFVGGLFLALGVVSALLERERTGVARALDLSNQDAIFAITDSWATIAAGLGMHAERVGNQHSFTAPYDALEARDGW